MEGDLQTQQEPASKHLALSTEALASISRAASVSMAGAPQPAFEPATLGPAPAQAVVVMTDPNGRTDFVQIGGPDFPPSFGGKGRQLADAMLVPGVKRHDVLVDAQMVSRIIGARGVEFARLTATTGCKIYVFDKLEIPGWPGNKRLVALVGSESSIDSARHEIDAVLARAEECIATQREDPTGSRKRSHAETFQGQLSVPGVGLNNWAPMTNIERKVAGAMNAAPAGVTRFDMGIDQAYVGRLIGQRGATLKDLIGKSGECAILIDDKDDMPGYPPGTRQVRAISDRMPCCHTATSPRPACACRGFHASVHRPRASHICACAYVLHARMHRPPRPGITHNVTHNVTHSERCRRHVAGDVGRAAMAGGDGQGRSGEAAGGVL